MSSVLPALRGTFASVTLALSTLIGVTAMFPFALAKLLLPFTPVRHVTDRALNAIATGWIGVNSTWMDWVGTTRWDVRGLEGLEARGWYLVSSNHQSWVDILVLQKIFNRRIPMLKFFLKRELIWVPVIGLAWWALDFPFMQRRGGASSAQDLERARKACEKFRVVPTSVFNFPEGTRFTGAKHDTQGSPFAHLLKPKADRLPRRPPGFLDAALRPPARGDGARAAARDSRRTDGRRLRQRSDLPRAHPGVDELVVGGEGRADRDIAWEGVRVRRELSARCGLRVRVAVGRLRQMPAPVASRTPGCRRPAGAGPSSRRRQGRPR